MKSSHKVETVVVYLIVFNILCRWQANVPESSESDLSEAELEQKRRLLLKQLEASK